MPTHFPQRIRDLPRFDGPFDAHRLVASGCEVLFASYPAGTAIATHTHDSDNLGVITHGELILTMDGREQRFGPGQWYRVPAHAPHAARFEADSAEVEFWFKESP